MADVAEPLVCAGCALLCDDATARVSEEEGIGLAPDCRLGARWLASRAAPGDVAATIDGEPADVERALSRAAELLRGAARPLLHGFGEATVEDARAAAALADAIGAIVTAEPLDGPWPGASATALRGAATATLGEIRDRARLVVIWREDPETTHPRLLARLGFGETASQSALAGGRTLAVVDDRDTATAARADVRLNWPADDDLQALRWLLARSRGVEGDGELFGPGLAELVTAADHVAVIYGPGLTAGAGGQRRALALHDLTRALSDDRQAVTFPLPAAPGLRGADDVLAWQTGYPGTVDLARGHPESLTATRPLLADEAVDVAVCVGGDGVPDGVRAIALSPLPAADAAVAIRTAAPGVGVAGTMHRCDGVPLTLRAPLASTSTAPTAAALLDRLRGELVG